MSIKPVTIMQQASHQAMPAGRRRSRDGDSDIRYDRDENRKQKAVTGDIYPACSSPGLFTTTKPRCSASVRMPSKANTKSIAAISAPAELINRAVRYVERRNGMCVQRDIIAAYITNSTAVLGATGILPGPRLARTGSPSTHPRSATRPIPARSAAQILIRSRKRIGPQPFGNGPEAPFSSFPGISATTTYPNGSEEQVRWLRALGQTSVDPLIVAMLLRSLVHFCASNGVDHVSSLTFCLRPCGKTRQFPYL